MIYTGYMRPYVMKLSNNLELINDTFIILCSYFLVVFSGLVTDAYTRYICGWPLIAIVGILIFINLTVIMYKGISQIIRAIRLRVIRRRNRKQMENRMKEIKLRREALKNSENHEKKYICQGGYGSISSELSM